MYLIVKSNSCLFWNWYKSIHYYKLKHVTCQQHSGKKMTISKIIIDWLTWSRCTHSFEYYLVPQLVSFETFFLLVVFGRLVWFIGMTGGFPTVFISPFLPTLSIFPPLIVSLLEGVLSIMAISPPTPVLILSSDSLLLFLAAFPVSLPQLVCIPISVVFAALFIQPSKTKHNCFLPNIKIEL